MPTEISTTKKQRDIISHAIDLDRRVKNSLKKRNKLKEDELRNYFCVAVGSDDDAEVAKLIEMGLMVIGCRINNSRDYYAFVTEAGIKEVMP